MAAPINFKPAPVDPTIEQERQLAAAPKEHAEALLVLWELLQTSHDQGLLDLAHGLVGGKDYITGKISAGLRQPEAIAALRNLISLTKVLGALPPDTLDNVARGLSSATAAHQAETDPPSLLTLTRRATSEDARRGLSLLTLLLTALGRATSSNPEA